MSAIVRLGDCFDVMRSLPPNSIDAVVTDPPYGLGFMGRAWDALPPGVEWAREVFRVLKPGGHVIAFGGQRTIHRLACALEDGGFEIRDQIGWVFWNGFPKSLDVSKAIDKAAGAEREVIGMSDVLLGRRSGIGNGTKGHTTVGGTIAAAYEVTAPATDAARQWNGYGTALKPAIEPAVLARKSLDGTVAANVLRYGTGALNIDGCRYPDGDPAWPAPVSGAPLRWEHGRAMGYHGAADSGPCAALSDERGRWPANLYACPKASRAERERGLTVAGILCTCDIEEVTAWESAARSLAADSVKDTSAQRATTESGVTDGSEWPMLSNGNSTEAHCRQDGKSTTSTATSSTTGSKTSKRSTQRRTSVSTADVNIGTACGTNHAASAVSSSPSAGSTGTSAPRDGRSTEDADPVTSDVWWRTSEPGEIGRRCLVCQRRRATTGAQATGRKEGSAGLNSPRAGASRTADMVLNAHSTVKPVRLMRWLVRLVTPPGGVVLDPFLGSGTTGIAAVLEGFDFIGVEREPEYHAIAAARVRYAESGRWEDDPPEAVVEEFDGATQLGLFGVAP